MNRRKVTVIGVATLMVALLATPASAHATFQGVKSGPANSDVQLTLNVPEEEGPTVHNIGVSAKLPAGWTGIACAPIAGWSCVLEPSPAVVRWTRDAGAPDTAQETFAFTAHTGPAGDFPVPVAQTYAGGEVVNWIGASGSETPAPVFRVTAAPSTPAPSTPAPTAQPSLSPSPAVSASPSPSPAASPAASPAQTPTASPSPAAVAGIQQRPGQTLPRTGDNDLVPALIAILLVALGGGALLIGWRRRHSAT